MKTMQEKRTDALHRFQGKQEAREAELAELVKGRKAMEGQRGITSDMKARRDEHIASVQNDVARRAKEIQHLKAVISQSKAY